MKAQSDLKADPALAPEAAGQRTGPGGAIGRHAPVVLAALAVWLGWQIVSAPLAAKAPPEFALKLAPGSSTVLQNAAQTELLAGRKDNAFDLAVLSLEAAPFNAGALRVAGLSIADSDRDRADQMLTLAGNLSLRDTPTHAWLIEQRLRQGNYGSAFAHADTLARRSDDVRPRVFSLFTTAMANDSRAIRPLVTRLDANPPWRAPYLAGLAEGPTANPDVLGTLALAMQTGKAPLSDEELGKINAAWVEQGRLDAVRIVRARIGRPEGANLVDGDFDATSTIEPFGWETSTGAGLVAEVAPDEVRAGEMALRVTTDSFSPGIAARQLLMLSPGSWTLSGQWRAEAGGDSNLDWTVTCLESTAVIGRTGPGDAAVPKMSTVASPAAATEIMSPFTLNFSVPAQNCKAQTLILSSRPGDRRRQAVVWFDDLQLSVD